jgi:hypothetical protein
MVSFCKQFYPGGPDVVSEGIPQKAVHNHFRGLRPMPEGVDSGMA